MTSVVNDIVATGAGGTLAAIAIGAGGTALAYITGTLTVGSTLTANVAAGLTATSWQWQSNGTPIGGATSATYVVQSGDAGKTLTVVVNGILTSPGVVIAGSVLTPTISLDFTSTVPAQITFARTGSRTAIVAGVLTTVTTGNPAIESLVGVPLGLSIDPGSTNQLLQSNTFTTTWSALQVSAPTQTVTGPDGTTSGWDVAETAVTNFHEVSQNLSGVASGTVMCSSVFIKAKSGATTNAMGVYNSNQFSNTGARASGMVDASAAVMAYDLQAIAGGTVTFNSVSGGSQRLANGWTRVYCVATATATGTKTVRNRSLAFNAAGLQDNFLGVVTNGFEIACAQTEFGVTRPTNYKATTTSTSATTADSAIFTAGAFALVTPSQGTFVIEHDVTSGVLLGSGVNTLIAGAANSILPNHVTGKVALAWDGTTSDLVTNGGATTAGGLPTFGADIRLLATSGATTGGHIKSLAYYPTRLSVAQIQALTAPASTAPAAGTYRVAAQRNVLQNSTLTIPGTNPKQGFVWPATIGSGDRTKVRVSVGNWWLVDATGDTNTGNSVIIESAILILTSTGEFTPILWGGLRSNTMADGLVKLNSDDILPSAFPSLVAGGVIPNLGAFQVKAIVKPSAAGGKIPVGRWGNETGCQCIQFDAAVTTVSIVDAIGNFTLVSGSAFTTSTKGFSFVLEGPFTAGDPNTYVGYGDSIVEGVGSTLVAGGTWFNNAATTLNAAYLQVALGGQSQVMFWKSTNVNSFSGLGNILIDNTGTNTQGGTLYYPLPYYNARQSGIRYIVRPSLNVRSTSTDNWATNGNQTASLVYPDADSIGLQALATAGFIDQYYKMNSCRDTGDKWITNGVAQTYTPDGTHQQPAGNTLMTAELVTQLQLIVLV